MRIDIEPTEEMWAAGINGTRVPVRIWRGQTDNGAQIEAYVLSIVPCTDADAAKLRECMPSWMVRSRDLYAIDVDS